MSRLTRDGTAEPVSRDQILRHARGQGNIHFSCSADYEQDWQPYPVDPYSAICDDHTYTQSIIDPSWEDQCEWHRMARLIGADCAVMCNLTNTHTHTHTHTHTVVGGTLLRWIGALTFGYGCTVYYVGVDVGAGDAEVDVMYISFVMSVQYIGYLIPYVHKVQRQMDNQTTTEPLYTVH